MENKTCTTCHVEKPVSSFSVCRTRPTGGFANRCKDCNAEAHRKWTAKHPSLKPIHTGGKPGPHNGFKPNPMTAPTLIPNDIDLAWAAGIYEGEGSIYRSPQCYAGRGLKVSIAQKDPWILHRLRELFGGAVTRTGSRNIYHWRLSGPRGSDFVKAIYYFMSPRRKDQLDDAMGD
jgi:hypothetical protein